MTKNNNMCGFKFDKYLLTNGCLTGCLTGCLIGCLIGCLTGCLTGFSFTFMRNQLSCTTRSVLVSMFQTCQFHFSLFTNGCQGKQSTDDS